MTHQRVRDARPRSDTNVFMDAPASTFVRSSAFWLLPGSNTAFTAAGVHTGAVAHVTSITKFVGEGA